MLNVLRGPAFRRMFGAHLVSQIGSGVIGLALPLIATVTLEASALQVGVLRAMDTAPILVLGLLAGIWVDRRPRRPLMIAADWGRFLVLLAIPLAAWWGVLRFDLLVVVTVVMGALGVVFDVAAPSYLARVLDHDDLVHGNSLLYVGYAVGEIAGPGLAGVLIQLVTAPFAVVVDAGSFLVSGWLLRGIHDHEPPGSPAFERRSLRAELGEGLRAVARTPVLRTIGVSTGVWHLFRSAQMAMLVVFLDRTLTLSAGMIGLVFAVGSVGLLIGSLVPATVVRWIGIGPAIMVGAAIAIPGRALIALAHGTPILVEVLVATGMFLNAAASALYDVNQVSLRQAVTPTRLQGRTAAVLRVTGRGMIPLGAILGGVIASLADPRSAMWLGVIGPPITIGIIWFSPVRAIRRTPAPDLDSDSGPLG